MEFKFYALRLHALLTVYRDQSYEFSVMRNSITTNFSQFSYSTIRVSASSGCRCLVGFVGFQDIIRVNCLLQTIANVLYVRHGWIDKRLQFDESNVARKTLYLKDGDCDQVWLPDTFISTEAAPSRVDHRFLRISPPGNVWYVRRWANILMAWFNSGSVRTGIVIVKLVFQCTHLTCYHGNSCLLSDNLYIDFIHSFRLEAADLHMPHPHSNPMHCSSISGHQSRYYLGSTFRLPLCTLHTELKTININFHH